MDDLRQLIVDSGVRMLGSGLTVETWGNISARDPQTGLIYLTPSGMDYRALTVDDVVTCNLGGEVVAGRRTPTIEKDLHLLIYRNRADVNAIVHTHPIYSLVFGCLGETIPQCIDEAAQVLGGPVRVATYALPGTQELAMNCLKALGEHNACVLQSHGAVCVEEDMDGAFRVAKVLEMTAQIYYMARTLGQPHCLTQGQIDYMQDFVKNRYGKDNRD